MGQSFRLLFVCPAVLDVLHFGAALQRLAGSHTVHVLTESMAGPAANWVQELQQRGSSLTIQQVQPRTSSRYLAALSRGCLDIWNVEACIGRRAVDWLRPSALPPAVLDLAAHPFLCRTRVRNAAAGVLQGLARALPVDPGIVEQVRSFGPDLLIGTPVTAPGSLVPDFIQAARHLGIRTLGVARGWNDFATSGPMHHPPDAIAVWNAQQRKQLTDSQAYPGQLVAAIGAHGLEDCYKDSPEIHSGLLTALGIEPGATVVCVRGSDDESVGANYMRIRMLLRTLRKYPEPSARNAWVLICPTEDQVGLWKEVGVRDSRTRVLTPSQFMSALHVSRVLITFDMAGVLEAAAVGCQVNAFLDRHSVAPERDVRLFRSMYGVDDEWLQIAADRAVFVEQLAERFRKPLDPRVRADARLLVRPHGPELPVHFLFSRNVVSEVMAHEPGLVQPPSAPAWARKHLQIGERIARWLTRDRVTQHHVSGPYRILIAAASERDIRQHSPVLNAFSQAGHSTHILIARGRGMAPSQSGEPTARERSTIQAGDDVWDVVRHTWRQTASLIALKQPGGPAANRYEQLLSVPARIIANTLWRLFSKKGPGFVDGIVQALQTDSRVDRVIAEQRPDLALVISPLESTAVFAETQLADVVASCKRAGVLTCATVGGTEPSLNTTLLAARPDAALVWADDQRKPAQRYLGRHGAVLVSGAAAFDPWLDPETRMGSRAFHKALRLREGPFVLFVGSAAPQPDSAAEVDFVVNCVRALREHADPRLRELGVLIRPAPGHEAVWGDVEFSGLGPVVLCPREYDPSGDLDYVLFSESIRHATAVVTSDPLTLLLAPAMGRRAIGLAIGQGMGKNRTNDAVQWVSDTAAACNDILKSLHDPAGVSYAGKILTITRLRPDDPSQTVGPRLAARVLRLAATGRRSFDTANVASTFIARLFALITVAGASLVDIAWRPWRRSANPQVYAATTPNAPSAQKSPTPA